ncbi:hypothetical protein [Amycolatopsis sp. DSM 110486]|uniref:hypothetical protein n=1 Tax=Amycolatopsis sp. DSM 110486 TaxID=2865832 RepID=UPI002107F2F6|nr:hypothetical protein [Amycolatopsis sp. DSM 110486]
MRCAIARDGYVTHRVFFADEATAAGFRPLRDVLRGPPPETEDRPGERRNMEVLTSPLLTRPATHDADLMATDVEIEAIVRLARGRGARDIAIGSGRTARALATARSVESAWDRAGGRTLGTVTWPETAASWLRPASRFAAADPDLWIMTGPATGWAQMTRRLLWSTRWSPDRTLATAGIGDPRTLALVGLAHLDGLAGATADGALWRVAHDRFRKVNA